MKKQKKLLESIKLLLIAFILNGNLHAKINTRLAKAELFKIRFAKTT